jgi:hypothetical protein
LDNSCPEKALPWVRRTLQQGPLWRLESGLEELWAVDFLVHHVGEELKEVGVTFILISYY